MMLAVLSASSSSLKGLITSPGVEIKLESPSIERRSQKYNVHVHRTTYKSTITCV